MQRTASAVWRGGLKDGKGTISSQSGVLKDTQYSFSTRFENGIGTNPEELIAAGARGVLHDGAERAAGGGESEAGFTGDDGGREVREDGGRIRDHDDSSYDAGEGAGGERREL